MATLDQSPPNVDDFYYVSVYGLYCLLFFLVGFASCSIMFTGSLNASRKIHFKLITSITGAKFQFFDVTPQGQLMNRFSKDLQVIDQNLAAGLGSILSRIVTILSQIILISSFMPKFLFPVVVLSIVYALAGMIYLQSARSLKRLEAAQRSPLHQQFGEVLRGMVTIRAYGDEARFVKDNAQRIDAHSRPFLALWSTTRWLAFRFDLAGAAVTFSAAAFILLSADSVDLGAAGLSLTYALSFNDTMRWSVSQSPKLLATIVACLC